MSQTCMSQTWIRYDGPGHLLKLSDTLILGLGSAAPVDDEQVKLLLESPDVYGVVTVIDGPSPNGPVWPDNHTDLDAVAEKLGVTFPDPVAPKKKLTVEEKVAALEAAGDTPADVENIDTKE